MYRFGVGHDHTTEMVLPDIAARFDSSVIAQFETSHSQIIENGAFEISCSIFWKMIPIDF